MAGPGGGSLPPKRKEIYKYEAPCTVFSMNWSVRPDKRFRYHMDLVKLYCLPVTYRTVLRTG
jgi:hypothetical protein